MGFGSEKERWEGMGWGGGGVVVETAGLLLGALLTFFGHSRNQPFILFSAFVVVLSSPRLKPWPANIIVIR